MKTLALCLENVEKYFPPALSGWRAFLQPVSHLTVPALRGVSFEVQEGEVLAVVGADGAGKTTRGGMLTTLLLPTSGRASVRGFDTASEPSKVRSQIGYHTGGDLCFYSRLSARENLLLFAGLNNLTAADAARRIDEIAGLFGIGELLDRQVRTLSTGNVHRLGLARAMLHRPSVLILDEPTRSLDPLAAAEFRRFIRQDVVGAHGATLIFASHSLGEVEQLAGRIAVLDGGRLLACGTLAEIKSTAAAGTLEESLEVLAGRAMRETR